MEHKSMGKYLNKKSIILLLLPLLLTSCSDKNKVVKEEREENINQYTLSIKDAKSILIEEKLNLAGEGPFEELKRSLDEIDKKNKFYKNYDKCLNFEAIIGDTFVTDITSPTYLYILDPEKIKDENNKNKWEIKAVYNQRTETINEDNSNLINQVIENKDCLIKSFNVVFEKIASNLNAKIKNISVNSVKNKKANAYKVLNFNGVLTNFNKTEGVDNIEINLYYIINNEGKLYSEYYLLLVNGKENEIILNNLLSYIKNI